MKYFITILAMVLLAAFVTIVPCFGSIYYAQSEDQLRTFLSTAATNGVNDTVYIAEGTFETSGGAYFDYHSWDDASITIICAGAGKTVLDALGVGRAMLVSAQGSTNAHITIRGVTFQNGSINSHGGGLWVEGSADVNIENCEFINNSSSYDGGGLMLHPAGTAALNATIRNSHFVNNTAGRG